jgi:hypothetical protein
VANGDTSDASDVNVPLTDLEADMNTPRPIVAGGTGVSSIAAFKAAFDLETGTDILAYDAGLQQIADLADPNADRLLFWDDSASAYTYLTVGANLSLSGTTLTAIDQTPADGSITFAKLAGAAVITSSETIASNDNDTTIPTSAAVIAQNLTVTTPVATTSGATVELSTSIPSWAKRVVVLFSGVSLSGSDSLLVQVGNSGSYVTSSYNSGSESAAGVSQGTTFSANGMVIFGGSASRAYSGAMTFTRFASGEWVATHAFASGSDIAVGSGIVTGAGTLTRIRLAASGANTYDAGSACVVWE